jgi:hypothetical protein
VVAVVKTKADAVFRLSEMVKAHVDSILRSLLARVTRFHQVPSLLWEGTATSANLCLGPGVHDGAFGKLCVGVGVAGKDITTPIASLCFGSLRGWFLPLGGPHLEEKRRVGW